jgi:signal transduction histidine kinase
LLGYFAEQEKKSRSEVAAMADAARQLRLDLGLDGAVRTAAEGLIEIFGARRVDCVVQEFQSQRGSLWQLCSDAATARIERIDLSAEQQVQWLFPDPGNAWHGARRTDGSGWHTATTSPSSWPVVWQIMPIPDAMASDARTITAVNIGRSDDWAWPHISHRCQAHHRRRAIAAFLEALSEYVTPGLTNALLLGRLRSQVTAAERARVARELHDGAIQALYGLRLRVQAIRRRTDRDSAEYDRELGELQDLLHHENAHPPRTDECVASRRPRFERAAAGRACCIGRTV